jgi:hypothetical protein
MGRRRASQQIGKVSASEQLWLRRLWLGGWPSPPAMRAWSPRIQNNMLNISFFMALLNNLVMKCQIAA